MCQVIAQGNKPAAIVREKPDRARFVDTPATMGTQYMRGLWANENLTAVARRMAINHNLARARRFRRHLKRLSDWEIHPPIRIRGIESPAVTTSICISRAAIGNHIKEDNMKSPNKDAKGFGMPWEDQYGYAQAVKVGDTIYVSGQLSHDDEGNMVGPAPLDANGKICDHSNMEVQMRQTYTNAKKILGRYGATLDNVVEEVLYVTDMDAAFAVAGLVRKEAYGAEKPQVASTILVTSRLALPTQLIEIKFIAKVSQAPA